MPLPMPSIATTRAAGTTPSAIFNRARCQAVSSPSKVRGSISAHQGEDFFKAVRQLFATSLPVAGTSEQYSALHFLANSEPTVEAAVRPHQVDRRIPAHPPLIFRRLRLPT